MSSVVISTLDCQVKLGLPYFASIVPSCRPRPRHDRRSYFLPSAGTVGLITAYSASVLRNAGRAATLGAGLGALYGYLYILLQLEDYALLLGAVGLFVILSAAMWLTRRVDWYSLSEGAERA